MLIAKNQKGLLVSALENGLNREETYRNCIVETGKGDMPAFCP